MRSRSPDCGRTMRGRRRGAHRVEVGEQVRFGRAAVLEVDDQPVEPGAGQDLGRDRRRRPWRRRRQGLAGLQPGAEVDEAGDGRQGGLVGHATHDACRHGRARGAARPTGTLTSPLVSTTSRSRPVMTSSSCRTSSSKRGSLHPGDVPGRAVVGEDHPVALERLGDHPGRRRQPARVVAGLEADAEAHRRERAERRLAGLVARRVDVAASGSGSS